MPTYNYQCIDCNHEFEEMHSVTEEVQECPKCKSEGKQSSKPKRLISKGTTFILNGGGWAREGYS